MPSVPLQTLNENRRLAGLINHVQKRRKRIDRKSEDGACRSWIEG